MDYVENIDEYGYDFADTVNDHDDPGVRGGDLNAFICDFVSFPLGPGGLYCSLVI